MAGKIINWLKANKKDIKIMAIGGIVLSLYILVAKLMGEKTDIGIVEAFFVGAFLTALFVNASRFWRKRFNKVLGQKDREGDYELTKEEIDNYSKKSENKE